MRFAYNEKTTKVSSNLSPYFYNAISNYLPFLSETYVECKEIKKCAPILHQLDIKDKEEGKMFRQIRQK